MNRLKFYVKVAVVKARALMFWFAPVRPNKDGWENRILLINLSLIGDMVMFTAVLKHYRTALPGKRIFLLLNGSSGVDPVFVQEYVDDVIRVDAEAFKGGPRYGHAFVKKMREIGFATVVEHNPGAEFVGKTIAVELGAETVIGYHGFAIDDTCPPDANFALGLRYFRRVLSKKFTTIIPTISEPNAPRRLAHMISHYAAIFEGVTGQKPADLVPRLPGRLPTDEAAQNALREHGIAPLSYCLLSLGTSTPHKEWPVERFAALGRLLRDRKIPIVLTGGSKDVPKSKAFVAAFGADGTILDLTGRTSLLKAASLVKFSLLAMSNDTSIAHFAIAFKRPSLAILWLAQPGRTSIYGYRDINKWIFKEFFPCFGDNGRCAHTVGPNDPAPCVAAVTVEDASRELVPLFDAIRSDGNYPKEGFSLMV